MTPVYKFEFHHRTVLYPAAPPEIEMDEFSKLSHPAQYAEYAYSAEKVLYWTEQRIAMRHVRKMYCCVIKFSQMLALRNEAVEGPFLDLLFYFTCKKYYPQTCLCVLRWDQINPPLLMHTVSVFGCLLSPSSWMACQKLDKKDRHKFSTASSQRYLTRLDQESPDLRPTLHRDVERDLLAVYHLYKLEPPFYELTDE